MIQEICDNSYDENETNEKSNKKITKNALNFFFLKELGIAY